MPRQYSQRWPAPDWQRAEEIHLAPRTPAEELLAGIWVELLNLERVGDQLSMVGALFQYKPGDQVQLTVQRGLVTMRLDIVLAERPATP